MEAPLAVRNSEEEEVMGMDLKTRRRSHHDHKLHATSPKSSESSITSDEDALDVENNRGNGTSNGENSSILESGSVNEEAQVEAEPMVEAQKEENAEEPNKGEDEIVVDLNGVFFSTNEGTNGDTIEYSLPESDVGSQDTTANSSSLSKSPDTAVGLKELESLLDESSNNLNFAAKDAYNALEDILTNAPKNVENKNENVHVILPKDLTPEIQEIDVEKEMQNHKHVLTLNNAPKSFENENGHHNLYKDPLPEVEEFDVESVERVIQKQETHDLYCPNCNSCITKRVILKRRKRKIQEISPSEDIVDGCTLTQPSSLPTSDGILEGNQENVPASVGSTADEPIYAITCLSCFSIFLPTQNGWLRRIFRRKPEIPLQSDASSTQQLVSSLEVPQGGKASADANIDDDKGSVFPLWIFNCCQPSSQDNKPVQPDMPVTEGLEHKIKPHLPVPDETLSSPKRKSHAKPDTHSPQSIEPVTSYAPPSEVPSGDASNPKPEPISDAGVDASLMPTQPLMTLDKDILSPLEAEPAPSMEADSASLPKPEPTPGQDILSPSKLISITPVGRTTLSPMPIHVASPDGDTSSPPKPTPPPTPDGAKTLPPELKPVMAPDDDITLLTDRKPPLTPHTGWELTITMPNQEPSKPLSSTTILSVIQPVAGTLNDLESHLLDTSQGRAATGERAGVDIIKAIVYGGLLECITSLSVITSAAGGDATTLNIVALGLANVFAGLVLLFHNLRVLKREYGTERYTQQMGRPGHFCLHATVAVISYLIFGLMAPIIYGFCFRKSDNKDYKLITLAAASLVCITVLSTAKAYVRSPPKAYLQTVFYYIGVGFAVSGAGYVAGDLTNMLLKKLGVFDSRSAPPEAGDMKGIWASY